MMAKLDICRKKKMDAWLKEMKDVWKEMTACQEAMGAYPEEMKSIAEHQEVPNEETIVESIRALEDRYGDRHPVVGCHRQPKKWTESDSGSWNKLAAAHRQLTFHTIPALCK
jgi:hypothetical protein